MQEKYGLNHEQFVPMKDTLCIKGLGIKLVHGPFGNGKTKLVTSFICEHVSRKERSDQRILVYANTNVAVGRVLKNLLASGFSQFCRVGSLAKIDPDIYRSRFTPSAQMQRKIAVTSKN